ncbi:MAG: hypothetical protein AAFX04_02895 [Pseudomonadota bacterium]
MIHLFTGDEKWFRQKSYGYGAGWPIKWQGWVLMASYLLVVIGIAQGLMASGGARFLAGIALLIIVSVLMLRIVHSRTEGGWRWRWND